MKVIYNDLCRLCTTSTGSKISIFSTYGQDMKLLEKILESLQIVITEVDRLPKKVCEECEKKLNDIISFRLACVAAQEKLESLATTLENGGTINIDEDVLKDSVHSVVSIGIIDDGNETIDLNDDVSVDHTGENITMRTSISKDGIVCIDLEDIRTDVHETMSEPIDFELDSINAKLAELSGKQVSTVSRIVKQQQIQQTSPIPTRDENEPNFECSRIHTDRKPFKCAEKNCESSFNQRVHLIRNIKCHAKKKQLKCELCNRKFRRQDSHRAHMQGHKRINETKKRKAMPSIPSDSNSNNDPSYSLTKRFKCTNCGKSFRTKPVLNQHMLVHSDIKPFQCSEGKCRHEFRRKYHLDRHMETSHSKEKLFSSDSNSNNDPSCSETNRLECIHCGKSFNTIHLLKRHVVLHSEIKPFICSEGKCRQKFRRKDYLDRHIQTHSKEKLFPCNYCEKTYGRKDTLKIHLGKHYNQSSTPTGETQMVIPNSESNAQCNETQTDISISDSNTQFDCKVCKKVFETKFKLRYHSVAFHPIIYTCPKEECKETFTSKIKLKGHKLSHINDIGTFKCDICEKGFARYKSLLTHKICHGPYRTDTTTQDSSLPNADVYKFECPENGCNKVYKKKVFLDVHLRSSHRNSNANITL